MFFPWSLSAKSQPSVAHFYGSPVLNQSTSPPGVLRSQNQRARATAASLPSYQSPQPRVSALLQQSWPETVRGLSSPDSPVHQSKDRWDNGHSGRANYSSTCPLPLGPRHQPSAGTLARDLKSVRGRFHARSPTITTLLACH